METEGLLNIQELTVVTNWSAVDENSPPTINITWAGRTGRPIAVDNITAVSGKLYVLLWLPRFAAHTVNETLEEMTSGLCYYDNDVFHYNEHVFGFENASSDGLNGWGSSAPGITTLNPYCGRRSLHVRVVESCGTLFILVRSLLQITGGRALLILDSSERLASYVLWCSVLSSVLSDIFTAVGQALS